MTRYAVGDVQGCLDPLLRLLDRVHFDEHTDVLWFAGDMINRGPDSLNTLRFAKDLGKSAVCVLGNHDLHLLATSVEARRPSKKDTLDEILNAADRDELLHWLRQQPLVFTQDHFVLSHAGIPHIWSANEAAALADEVTEVLRGENYHLFLQNMYGNEPLLWNQNLESWERLRVITNYLTRMRIIKTDGTLDLGFKEGPEYCPEQFHPWFQLERPMEDDHRVFLFGHWASLEGETNNDQFEALDTGCVWGGPLTLINLETRHRVQVKT